MSTTPFQVHAQTLADYLAWLNAQAGGGSDPSDPNATVPVFTWRNANYACNFSWTEQKYLDQGGYVQTQMLVLEVLEPMPVIRADQIPGPAVKDVIQFLNKDFRVEIVKHANGKNPQLTCWDLSRGA